MNELPFNEKTRKTRKTTRVPAHPIKQACDSLGLTVSQLAVEIGLSKAGLDHAVKTGEMQKVHALAIHQLLRSRGKEHSKPVFLAISAPADQVGTIKKVAEGLGATVARLDWGDK